MHGADSVMTWKSPMNYSIRILLLCFSMNFITVAAGRADDEYDITPDVVYGHKAGMALTFDVIKPREPNGAGVMFMMSGGWFSGWIPPEALISPKAPDGFNHFRDLVDAGYTLFIVRHGSAPQFKVPEAVVDVRRATRYIRRHAKDFGVDPDRLGVCGGSAGGHLSLMLGTTADDGAKEPQDDLDRTSDRVGAVVAYYPPVDLREWVGPNDQFPALEFDPQLAESVSPLLHVTPDDAPTLLVHGDQDGLVKLDNSERILAALEKQKVPCKLIVMKGAGHHFPGEHGKQATQALIEWFDTHLAEDAATAGGGANAHEAAAAP
jgi:acetyl esterase/lipase